MRILLIEDGEILGRSIIDYLQREGYQCEWVQRVDDAFERVLLHSYDCLLLDITLPDGSGLSVLERLKEEKKMDGVIIISAKDSIDDRIKGLKLGADDYLSKPFHLSELGARVEAVIRRRNFQGSNKITFHELTVDVQAHVVSIHNQSLSLTRKEYDLLLFLLANKGTVISKNAIAEHLSGDMADMLDNHSFVYAHIKNLKKKLNENGCRDYIKTIYGFGYRWEA